MQTNDIGLLLLKMMAESRIIFMDDYCNFCNYTVRVLLRLNAKEDMRFASLQGSAAKELLPSELTQHLSTLVYMKNGVIYTESSAAIRVFAESVWYMRGCKVLLLIPRFFRDKVYGLLSRNRYRIFGRSESCAIPASKHAHRFLP